MSAVQVRQDMSTHVSWCQSKVTWCCRLPTTPQVKCQPGRTLQEVLEVQLPELKASPYQVFQFPVRSLLNVQRNCTSVNGNEITIEQASDDYGKKLCVACRKLVGRGTPATYCPCKLAG